MRVQWTEELDAILRERFPTEATADLLPLIPGATILAVRTRARALGLRKTKEYRRSYLSKNREAAAEALRGHTPWNKAEPVVKVCESCGASFEVAPYRGDDARFCSRACKHEWQRTIRGEDHPLYTKEEATCLWCGDTFLVKRCHAEDPERGRVCSPQCRGAVSVAAQGGRTSSIEVAVAQEFDRRGIRYEAQHRVGRWLCDFYLPDTRTVVECDGTYWHSRPEVIERDARKDRYLTGKGYRVVRLTEAAINEDVAAAVGAI